MVALEWSEPGWQKSTYSTVNGCVEVAVAGQGVAVRDSKNQDGPVLRFTHVEWDAFVQGVKAGEFDPAR